MLAYFASLKFPALMNNCIGAVGQGLIWGLLALGIFISFRMLNIADMTVDGSFATGGVVCVMLIINGWNPNAALIVSFAAGLICGGITGVLHAALGIPEILAGILTQFALYAVNLNLLGKANQTLPIVKQRDLLFRANSDFLPRTILITALFVAVIIAVLYWYLNTEHGSALRATGINEKMARAQGINTKAMKVIGLSLADGMVALSGGIYSQYYGSADINIGRGAIVIGLASVIIGDVLCHAIFRKRMNLLLRLMFVVVGCIIYYIVQAFVIWLKLPSDDMKLLIAIVVALFLAVPNLKEARLSSFSGLAKRNARLAAEKEAGKNA